MNKSQLVLLFFLNANDLQPTAKLNVLKQSFEDRKAPTPFWGSWIKDSITLGLEKSADNGHKIDPLLHLAFAYSASGLQFWNPPTR